MVNELTIQSTREERAEAVSACAEEFISRGETPEDAQRLCNSEADKGMGTRSTEN